MAVEWITPKTDWVSTDRFNKEDYNRIRNNLLCLHDFVQLLYPKQWYANLGNEITSYAALLHADMLNAMEEELELLNQSSLVLSIGSRVTFYDNGRSIDYEELNRIESAQLRLYEGLHYAAEGMQMLPIVLGWPNSAIRD